ncbi:MAG: serine hydrolase domain-containing protein [Longimicrobiales bacterium]
MATNGWRRLLWAALLLAAFSWRTPPLAAIPLPQGNPPSEDSLPAAVDRIFERWHRPDSPGAAVLVLRGGEVVHAAGYGMADLEHGIPIRTTSVFDIASVSKQFGAMAVALLEAEGRLSLDDGVRKYIPELPDFGHPLTIRHLVHHTSGIRDWPATLGIAGWDYQDVISFQQILRMAFGQEELNFVPGTEHAYSNTGYNLLAEIVARVSGVSYREFCQERIFGPLEMTHTHVHDDHTEIVPDRAHSYRPAPGGEYHLVWNSLTALGSSSIFTTVEDLARWVGNFENPTVGGPGVILRMQERGVLTGGDTIPYAWGQSLGRYRGLETWSHGGSWAGYRTTLVRFPEQRFAVVILGNTTEMNPALLANRIADLYLADVFTEAAPTPLEPPHTPATTWRPSPTELEEYVGEYESEELLTSWRFEVREGALVARHFRTGEVRLRPLEPDRFQGGAFGEVLFLRDAAGRVTAFTANQTRVRGLRFVRAR